MARKSRKPENQDTAAAASTSKTVPAFPAWIYARISNDSEKADDSIDNQIALCKQFIHSGNHSNNSNNNNNESTFTLSGVFTDSGYSGTDFDRPGYTDMLTGILCGDVKGIIVKDLSRLGRTYIEVGELLFDTFVQYGVRFVSVNDNYDSFADDAGRKKLLILFKSLVNHMYSRDLGKKIKSAHDSKKRRGEPAGQAPYGYRIDPKSKRLEIVPEAAEVVKMIFDMRLRGDSISSISKKLNRMKIPSPQQRRYELGEISHEKFSGGMSGRILWVETLVSKLLHNETYTGSLFQGKYGCSGKSKRLLPKEQWIVHEDTHDAIISKEQFAAVAGLLEKTAAKYKHTGARLKSENRYAGKIFCERCGKAAVRSANWMKEPVLYYYSCRHCCYELKEAAGAAIAPKLPLKNLDAAIMSTIKTHMDALVRFDDLAETLAAHDPMKHKRLEAAKRAKKLERTLNDYENTLAAAYTHHLSGLLDMREYELVRARIEREKTQAELQFGIVKSEQSRYESSRALENQWLVKYREFRDCETPTKEMIHTLIGRIVLTPMTNEVKIELNFTEDFAELDYIIYGTSEKYPPGASQVTEENLMSDRGLAANE